jgi:hypothetical protein
MNEIIEPWKATLNDTVSDILKFKLLLDLKCLSLQQALWQSLCKNHSTISFLSCNNFYLTSLHFIFYVAAYAAVDGCSSSNEEMKSFSGK